MKLVDLRTDPEAPRIEVHGEIQVSEDETKEVLLLTYPWNMPTTEHAAEVFEARLSSMDYSDDDISEIIKATKSLRR